MASSSIRIAVDAKSASHNPDVFLWLFAAGGAAGLWNMTRHIVLFGTGFEMVALGENLAHFGSYANPFSVLATGPTAANPPLYPLVLALIFKIFRSPDLAAFIATLGNILANAFTAVLLARVSILFYRDVRPGVVAAVLWILSSPLLPAWDVGLTVPILLIFCLMTAATITKPKFVMSGLAAGLLAAALFLFNPSTTLIFLPWIGCLAFMHRKSPNQTIAYCCLIFGVLAVVGGAWGFRNQQQLGKFVLRTNLGMTLFASDNDCVRSSLIASEANNCFQAHHPNTSIQEAKLLSSLGEVEYDRLRMNDAKQWISDHPRPFLRLTLARVRDFWFPVPNRHRFKCAVIWIITLSSIPGLFVMARRRMEITPFVLIVLSVYPLMYYIVVSDVRYRLPVLWLSLLPAGVFLVELWELMSKPNQKPIDAL
jgi:hypothetical protein